MDAGAKPVEADEERLSTNDEGRDDENASEEEEHSEEEYEDEELDPTAVAPSSFSEKHPVVDVKSAADGIDELLRKVEIKAAQSKRAIMGASSKASSTRGSTGRGHGLVTEEEEDANIIEDEMKEDEPDWPIHFDAQPSCIKFGTMRQYQLESLNWMIRLHDSDLNGILADEMGLGKTLQSISMLGYLQQYRGIKEPHLVIVPKSTLGNWCREFERWCPSLSVLRYHGNKDERVALRQKLKHEKFDVICTTYEMTIREKAFLGKKSFHYMYIDEAHRIKNENSLLSQVVRMYRTKHRLLITGTPLQNNLHELWALLNFLVPDIFNSAEDFNQWFNLSDTEEADAMVKRLHRVLRPFLLRRLKTDVEKSLLPKVETILNVGVSEMQREWYTKLLTRDIDAINTTTGSRVRLLNILMQLRKATNHPYLFHGAEPGPPYVEGEHLIENSGKMVLLDKLLRRLHENGSRVLIFSQMTRMLDILEDYMRWRGYQYCRIDGQTGQDSRDEQMDQFNAKDSPFFAFLLSTRAGGLGINLQTADSVILYDSDWNPQMDLQAQDRAHRIGQKKQVHVYRLVTQGTVEEKIVERAYKKLFLDAIVIQQGRLAQKHHRLEANELASMVRFGADQIFCATGSTISDEDIDEIMSKGKKHTQQMTGDIQKSASFNMADFSLGSDEPANLYEFDGKDFKGARKNVSLIDDNFHFVALPARGRKQNYDVNQYYRSAMKPGQKARAPAQRKFKPSARHDFQFFDVQRIHQLEEKDFESKKLVRQWVAEAREKEREEKRIQKERERENQKQKDSGEDHAPVGDPADEANASLTKSSQHPVDEMTEEQKKANEREQFEKKAGCLTEAERAELESLEQAGFGNWNRRDFANYIRGCELEGRNEIEEISEHVPSKSLEEVRKYHKVFWKQYKRIADWKKIIKQIEKGEERIARRHEIDALVQRKMKSCKNPHHTLTFRYKGPQSAKSFSEEEDRFLFCTMADLGYGAWDELRMEVRRSWIFRFDWFIKSKSAQELGRRCDLLVKLVEAEFDSKKRKRKSSVSADTAHTSKKSRTVQNKTVEKGKAKIKKRPRR